jgi:anti-anti-sigma factor
MEPTVLDVAVQEVPGGARVTVSGELDAATASDLESALADAVASGGRVELDLSAVTFIDSSGLRALIVSRQAASDAGGTLVLGATTAVVDRLLQLTGLDESFPRAS